MLRFLGVGWNASPLFYVGIGTVGPNVLVNVGLAVMPSTVWVMSFDPRCFGSPGLFFNFSFLDHHWGDSRVLGMTCRLRPGRSTFLGSSVMTPGFYGRSPTNKIYVPIHPLFLGA